MFTHLSSSAILEAQITQLNEILLIDDDLRVALSEQLMMTEDFDMFEAGNLNDTLVRTKAWLF